MQARLKVAPFVARDDGLNVSDSTVNDGVVSWRFSLRTLIAATAYVAFALAWVRWTWLEREGLWTYYGGPYGICSAGCLLLAYVQLRLAAIRDRWAAGARFAWNLIALAWLLVVVSFLDGMFHALTTISAEPPERLAEIVQESVSYASIPAVSVPLLLTLPLLYTLLVARRSLPDRTTRWIFVSVAVAAVDGLLFAVVVSTTWGTWR